MLSHGTNGTHHSPGRALRLAEHPLVSALARGAARRGRPSRRTSGWCATGRGLAHHALDAGQVVRARGVVNVAQRAPPGATSTSRSLFVLAKYVATGAIAAHARSRARASAAVICSSVGRLAARTAWVSQSRSGSRQDLSRDDVEAVVERHVVDPGEDRDEDGESTPIARRAGAGRPAPGQLRRASDPRAHASSASTAEHRVVVHTAHQSPAAWAARAACRSSSVSNERRATVRAWTDVPAGSTNSPPRPSATSRTLPKW